MLLFMGLRPNTIVVLFYEPSLSTPLNMFTAASPRTLESVDMKTATSQPGLLFVFAALVLSIGACQRAPVAESNINTNLSTNANLTPANANIAAAPIASLAAREPDKYKATLVFTAQTEGGENTIG